MPNKIKAEDVKIPEDDSFVAAHAFVQSMVATADGALDKGISPFWHGWALFKAFQAGVAWEQKRKKS